MIAQMESRHFYFTKLVLNYTECTKVVSLSQFNHKKETNP